jgi:RimJ/RimL family protein N-acetyltransferase
VRHDFSLRGFAFGLRPVDENDAEFIVRLRSQPGRSRFLNRGAGDAATQRQWLATYFVRPDDYFFVIHGLADDEPHGTLGLYGVDTQTGEAEWGRWILREDSPAAVESALLVYRFAFESLLLRQVFCRTITENAQVTSFHDSCGLVRAAEEVVIQLDGAPRHAVEHRLDLSEWPAVQARLSRLAQRIASTLAQR